MKPAKNSGARDALYESLKKAQAMAKVTYGESGDGFRTMSTDLQDRFMWALSDLLDDACEALDEYLQLEAEVQHG